jgi:hypothetical protein
MALFSDWHYYITDYAEGPAAIGLYMDVDGAVAEHPWLHWLTITMIQPSQNGMFDEAEGEDLDKLDLAMEDYLYAKAGAALVGRISSAGKRTFFFYSYSKEKFDQKVRAFLQDYKYQYEFGQEYDPKWNVYENDLYPSKLEYWWMSVGEMINNMENEGDTLEIARRIDHWIYFPDGGKRDKFIASVQGDRFAIDNTWFNDNSDPDDNPGIEGFPYGLQIYRNDPAELPHLKQVITSLYQLAEDNQGYYDGLEAFTAKTDPQLASTKVPVKGA